MWFVSTVIRLSERAERNVEARERQKRTDAFDSVRDPVGE